MLMLLRHLLAVALLPFVMVVIVPSVLIRQVPAFHVGSEPMWDWFRAGAGTALFVGGFALFVWCVSLFARFGRGTLAPWDPTRHLVAAGPYAYVRNPMIGGVLWMLLGEAIFTGTRALGLWAATFLAFNQLYFILLEEPGLEQRFGQAYRTYKANVPRWIPRRQPWTGC